MRFQVSGAGRFGSRLWNADGFEIITVAISLPVALIPKAK